MKPKTFAADNLFKNIKSHSPEEVFAAGGTTAFSLKMGKTNESMIKALENSPPIEPFTDEEWAELMEEMRRDK